MLNQLKSHPMLDERKRFRLYTGEGGKTRLAGTDLNLAVYGRVHLLALLLDGPYGGEKNWPI